MTDKLSDKLLIIPKRRRPFQSLYCHNSFLNLKEMKEESFSPLILSLTLTHPLHAATKKDNWILASSGLKTPAGHQKQAHRAPNDRQRGAKRQPIGLQLGARGLTIGNQDQKPYSTLSILNKNLTTILWDKFRQL